VHGSRSPAGRAARRPPRGRRRRVAARAGPKGDRVLAARRPGPRGPGAPRARALRERRGRAAARSRAERRRRGDPARGRAGARGERAAAARRGRRAGPHRRPAGGWRRRTGARRARPLDPERSHAGGSRRAPGALGEQQHDHVRLSRAEAARGRAGLAAAGDADADGRVALDVRHVALENEQPVANDSGLPRPTLLVSAEGWATRALPVKSLEEGERDLGDVALEREAIATGRAVDDGGAPLAGVEVRLWRQRPQSLPREKLRESRLVYLPELMRVVSGADGRFTLRGLWAGTAQLRIRAPGHVRQQRDLGLAESATLDLGDVVLPAGSSVAGRVVDGAGAPVVGARVLVADGEIKGGMVFDMGYGYRTATTRSTTRSGRPRRATSTTRPRRTPPAPSGSAASTSPSSRSTRRRRASSRRACARSARAAATSWCGWNARRRCAWRSSTAPRTRRCRTPRCACSARERADCTPTSS
jgi:hypothetical protein